MYSFSVAVHRNRTTSPATSPNTTAGERIPIRSLASPPPLVFCAVAVGFAAVVVVDVDDGAVARDSALLSTGALVTGRTVIVLVVLAPAGPGSTAGTGAGVALTAPAPAGAGTALASGSAGAGAGTGTGALRDVRVSLGAWAGKMGAYGVASVGRAVAATRAVVGAACALARCRTQERMMRAGAVDVERKRSFISWWGLGKGAFFRAVVGWGYYLKGLARAKGGGSIFIVVRET